jgi:small redox-active disulfide protein 2
MKIEVVGTGCPTCKQLYALTLRAAGRIGNDAEVEYVTEQAGMKRLMELGLMRSPALVVNGKVAMVGYEPSIEGIKEKILETAK